MILFTAYQLGAVPSLVGVHFNILGLLARVQDAGGGLRSRVNDQAQRLTTRRNETVELVVYVESLLDQQRLQRPSRPQTYVEYEQWAQSIATQVRGVVEKDVHESAACLLGYALGDLMLSVAVLAIAIDFLGAAPDHAFLRQQASSLAASEAKARKTLELSVQNPALPAPTTALGKEVVAAAAVLDGLDADRGELFKVLEAKRLEIARTFVPGAATNHGAK